jgi:hypothetical protein
MTFASLGTSESADPIIEFTGPDAREQLIGFLFVRSWSQHSGHPVPAKPSGELTRQELIDFWADPSMQPR